MTKFTSLKKPYPTSVPSLCLERDDIRIMAEHFGYDYGSCLVQTSDDTVVHSGYCLINPVTGMVVDDVVGWRDDDELLRKFWEYDRSHGFIDSDVSLEDFIMDARKKRA